jgi:hypothetical protein
LRTCTPEGARADETLDKVLNNWLFAFIGGRAIYEGDIPMALAVSNYGSIMQMDRAKTAMRNTLDAAIESKAFTVKATEAYKEALKSNLSGKHKAGSLMGAVSTVFGQLPLLGTGFDYRGHFGGSAEPDSRAFWDVVTYGAIFYGLNASRIGMRTYRAKADAVQAQYPFNHSLKSGESSQALATRLDTQLAGAIAQFKKWA